MAAGSPAAGLARARLPVGDAGRRTAAQHVRHQVGHRRGVDLLRGRLATEDSVEPPAARGQLADLQARRSRVSRSLELMDVDEWVGGRDRHKLRGGPAVVRGPDLR